GLRDLNSAQRAAVDERETAIARARAARVAQCAAFEHEIGGIGRGSADTARRSAVADFAERKRALRDRRRAGVGIGAVAARDLARAGSSEANRSAVVDDLRSDGDLARALLLNAARAAARAAGQRAARDELVVVAGGGRHEDRPVYAERFPHADRHRR